ncbi:MAG: peptidase M48 family protein [Sphingomonadales bacterium]|nr:peptidase M48 family protein [Sphingomonadales bacterium]
MIKRVIVLLAILIPAAFPGALLADSIRATVEQLRATDLRVATVAFRLFTRNADRCPAQMPATGLLLHSLGQYSAAAQPAVLAIVPTPSVVSVLGIVEASPAAHAGIQPGDGIEAVNDVPVAAEATASTGATYLRDKVERQLVVLPPDAPIRLLIRRGNTYIPVVVMPVPACRSRLEVVAGKTVVARSDGHIIQVGQAFAERIDDDGLAVALAHELAHTILRHRDQLAELERLPATAKNRQARAALARRAEDEADLFSLQLLAAAGWDPAIAPRFMRHEGLRFDPMVPGSKPHRSASQRAAQMEQELTRLNVAPPACLDRSPSCR